MYRFFGDLIKLNVLTHVGKIQRNRNDPYYFYHMCVRVCAPLPPPPPLFFSFFFFFFFLNEHLWNSSRDEP